MRKSLPLLSALVLAVGVFFYAKNRSTPLTPPTVKEETTLAQGTAQPWPHSQSDIAADQKTTFGSLANGMRYIIYPNAEPPKRVSIRLHIATGSLMEADDQQGLAHFLEHMVFNGTKNFTPSELIPRMQRLGIGFGAHVNAYTSFDETVYMLDLPDLSQETTELAYTVMRDFADGALLDAKEIDKERGVILSEKVNRDSVSYRMMQRQFGELLPQSLLPKRFPIGTEECIKNVPRQRFVDYYTAYYTPERMTFIVVGDIDPKQTEEWIEKAFGSLKNPTNPGKNPDLGSIDQVKGLETAVFTDKELTSTELGLVTLRAYEKKPDTEKTRAERMSLELAHAILNRRLERLTKLEDATIISGSASRSPLFQFVEIGSIDVTAKDDNWQAAVAVLEQEFRRAREHGFTEAEFLEAKANLLNAYEQQLKAAATRKSDALATAIAQSINDQSVLSSPQTDLDLARKALDAMNPQICHQAFQQFWQAEGYHLILSSKEAPETAKQELAALYEASTKVTVKAPETKAAAVFAYTDFGTPGKVESQELVKDLDITQLTLSNGIKVNLKKTDFEKNTIRLSARLGHGSLTMPKNQPGLAMIAGDVFNGGGLGKHSVDELQQVLAGKNVGVSLNIGEDAFLLEGKTTPQDIELQLQLMCASLIDPGYREEALRQLRASLPMLEQQLKHTKAGPQVEIQSWMHGGDYRYSMPDIKTLASYGIDDVKAWLTPELTSAAMELSIVGDFSQEEILPFLLRTFGALPARKIDNRSFDALRHVNSPQPPARLDTTYQSKVAQAVSITSWKTMGLRQRQQETRRLNVLADILTDRLREEIRENLGASYSPNAQIDGSDALIEHGFLSAVSVGTPQDLEKLTQAAIEIGQELADKGVTADELDRALKPTLAALEKTLRDNTYWLSTVMLRSQEQPETLDYSRNRMSDYKSITVEQINALAKQYLSKKNTIITTIQSKE